MRFKLNIFHSCQIPAVLAVLILISFCGGCGSPTDATIVREDGEVWPSVLRIAYVPSSEDPEGRLKIYTELAEYLSGKIGIPVDLVKSSSYGPTIEAMRSKKIDVAQTGSFSYMIAHERVGAEALVTRGTRETGFGLYTSIIATHPNSPITSLEDLKSRAGELVFSFTDPASTSGHLIPRTQLENIGINPEEDFDEVVFTQSHLNSVMTVSAGKVDAGGMQESTFERMVEQGHLKPEDLRILWRSPPIPTGPIYCRGDLPQGLQDAIAQAYVDMDRDAPELMEAFRVSSRRPGMIYLRVDDSHWDGLRQMARNLDSMNLLD